MNIYIHSGKATLAAGTPSPRPAALATLRCGRSHPVKASQTEMGCPNPGLPCRLVPPKPGDGGSLGEGRFA